MTQAASKIAVPHYVTFWAIRMPHAHTIPLFESALVDLELGVCITDEVDDSHVRSDSLVHRDALRLF